MQAGGTNPSPTAGELNLKRGQELLEQGNFGAALASAQVMLKLAPGNREVLYLIAVSLRYLKRLPEALETLAGLERLYPKFGRLFQERGHCYRLLGDQSGAITAYQRAVALNDALAASWEWLRHLYRDAGRTLDSDNAARCLAKLNSLPAPIAHASSLLAEGEIDAAETILRDFLRTQGAHIEGMRLLAQIAIKHDILDDAEYLLEHVVTMAPDYWDARYEYAAVLSQRRRHGPQLIQAKRLLQIEQDNRNYRMIYAQACDSLGEYDEALRVYHQLLGETPENAELQLLIGHAQKTRGNSAAAIQAFRAAASARSGLGGAYLGLANMKTYRFEQEEIARMRTEEGSRAATPVDRYHLCFALGKALEDRAEFAESFGYYERGNALKRKEAPYKPHVVERHMRLQASVCTRDFFAARQGSGCDRADPIFVVGLPRSGSTLIEQILASHSRVDGTLELPDIPRLAHQFRNRGGDDDNPRYPAVLAELDAEEFKRMGETYLEETKVYRKDAPFFVDKMPANFREIGLIALILPNAKIIDARRDAMACGFGNFKQLFTKGQDFSYSLEDIGRYYRNYVELMEHWDRVLPGKILRVRHEEVVGDLEGNVRRMLDFCGLDFEPACLEFHKTARSVRTVSSEQVRRPIFREGLDQWRNFEPWLGPLRTALGTLAEGSG